MMPNTEFASTLRSGLSFPPKRYQSSTAVSTVASLIENLITTRAVDVRRNFGLAIQEHVSRLASENRELQERLLFQEKKLEDGAKLPLEIQAGYLREKELSGEILSCKDEIRGLKRRNLELQEEASNNVAWKKEAKRMEEELQSERDKVRQISHKLQEIIESKDQVENKSQQLLRERESLISELESERNTRLSSQKLMATANERSFELASKLRDAEERFDKFAASKKNLEEQLKIATKKSTDLAAAAVVRPIQTDRHREQCGRCVSFEHTLSDLKFAKSEVSRLEGLVASAKDRDIEKSLELEKLKWVLERSTERVGEESSRLKESLREKELEVARVKDKLVRVKAQLAESTAKYNSLAAQHGGTEAELRRVREECGDKDSQLTLMGEKNQQLLSVLHQEEMSNNELRETVKRQNLEMNLNSTNAAAVKSAKISTEGELVKVKADLAGTQALLSDSTQQQNTLKRNLGQTQLAIDSLEKQVHALEIQVVQIANEKKYFEDMCEGQLGSIRQLEASLQIKDGQIASLMELNSRLNALSKVKTTLTRDAPPAAIDTSSLFSTQSGGEYGGQRRGVGGYRDTVSFARDSRDTSANLRTPFRIRDFTPSTGNARNALIDDIEKLIGAMRD